jgi:hypothetical protein
MNTSSIAKCLKTLLYGRNIPIYVIAADETHKISYETFPFIVVQNTREYTHTGQHWTAWVIWSEDAGDFFDSYGQDPRQYPKMMWPVKTILRRNDRTVQGLTTYLCGEHCIFWSFHRINGMPYKKIMRMYTKWPWYNDRMVTKFVNRIQNVHRHSLYSNCRTVQTCVCRIRMIHGE